jgi:hypothetical protein
MAVTINEDDSTPTDAIASMPISWNADSIDTLVSELWTNEDSYTFLLANFGGCVVGMNSHMEIQGAVWRKEAFGGIVQIK